MKILSIETSCDETAIGIVEAEGNLQKPTVKVLGEALYSQISIHAEYGGVYPNLAKREHARNLAPLLKQALEKSGLYKESTEKYPEEVWTEIKEICHREEGLYENFREIFENIKNPKVDFISVTYGPGLEPALWVGISFSKALSLLWGTPVVPVNHMEGHITSVLGEATNTKPLDFPALALLISGGHTELVHIEKWGDYKILGQTRDDAVGEAFDKVARMIGLPYPGGPEVSRLAEKARTMPDLVRDVILPRPMIISDNLDFSFSGLKTAVLYYLRDKEKLSEENKLSLAKEFEDAVTEVLLTKTSKALKQNEYKTFIIGGGVIANKFIKESFFDMIYLVFPNIKILIPDKDKTSDNALMIAFSGYIKYLLDPEILKNKKDFRANGNLKIDQNGLL
ncbi:MAG: tRNA (adenosine(37)-N6)-threonylcarbamoyltransferase complex transferase subunit TsaD [Candidatus Paceibacterota bacterium]